jgi:hypothetical protein
VKSVLFQKIEKAISPYYKDVNESAAHMQALQNVINKLGWGKFTNANHVLKNNNQLTNIYTDYKNQMSPEEAAAIEYFLTNQVKDNFGDVPDFDRMGVHEGGHGMSIDEHGQGGARGGRMAATDPAYLYEQGLDIEGLAPEGFERGGINEGGAVLKKRSPAEAAAFQSKWPVGGELESYKEGYGHRPKSVLAQRIEKAIAYKGGNAKANHSTQHDAPTQSNHAPSAQNSATAPPGMHYGDNPDKHQQSANPRVEMQRGRENISVKRNKLFGDNFRDMKRTASSTVRDRWDNSRGVKKKSVDAEDIMGIKIRKTIKTYIARED